MRDSLDLDYSSIPVSALKSETRDTLSTLLDPPKIILTDDGFPRDWRGLAHLTGISSAHVPSLMISDKPTATVLYRWSQKGVQIANFKKIQEFLQNIDRYDVLEDTANLFETDAQSYLHSNPSSTPLIKSGAPSTTDNEIITKDDANLAHHGVQSPQFYDAFVLYADEDVNFVQELVQKMEACGFKLCLTDRDLLGGVSSHHAAIMKLIAERCHRLIIILSPAFVESPLNNFLVEFALIGGIKEGKRKIIPCVYKSCDIQRTLSGYFLLFYNPDRSIVNFWDKLRDSLLLSPSERLALGETAESATRNLPTSSSSNVTETIDVFPLDEENLESAKQTNKPFSSSLDLGKENNRNVSSSSNQIPKASSNPSINTKTHNGNWYNKILKIGQYSSKHLKFKKKKKNKLPVLAS